MDRIKRLSYEVLEKYKSRFGENFTDNKKSLDEIAIVRSKGLKNEVAGYITNFIKKENRETELNLSRSTPSKDESTLVEESTEITTEPNSDSEENVIEVGADAAEISENNETFTEKTE